LAGPDSARLVVVPWQFDPAGHLLLGVFDHGPPQLAPPGAPSTSASTGDPPNQRLALLDVRSGRLLSQVGLGDVIAPSAVAWSHDGRMLAVGTYQGTVTLYDAATLRERAAAGSVVPGTVESASFAPDDRTLVVGSTDAEMSFFSVPDLAARAPGSNSPQ
jgi:WD40 repeat protein